jgi:hypothetical protein
VPGVLTVSQVTHPAIFPLTKLGHEHEKTGGALSSQRAVSSFDVGVADQSDPVVGALAMHRQAAEATSGY